MISANLEVIWEMSVEMRASALERGFDPDRLTSKQVLELKKKRRDHSK